MLRIADLVILPRTFVNPREELKNWLMLLMRTERIKNACKDWLINFKPKTYKKQIEEAEEIAALNLAKFRQAQGLLADAEERADLNEQALAKAKVKGRAGSSIPM